MNPQPTQTAVVLLAHGSRDSRWAEPIEAVAQRVRSLDPQATVCCAYLEHMQPDLATCVAQLLDQGQADIRILPLFLGIGGHVRQDLPRLHEQMLSSHPGLRLRWYPAAGESPMVTDVLARIALQDPNHTT